jgi:death-on-curing protein
LTARGLSAIHEELVSRYGGLQGIRDLGALESAVARPHHLASYLQRIFVPRLAAAYVWGLLRNHPFVDGNKRVALASLIIFLELNGWDWLASEVEETAKLLAAAAGEISGKEWIKWVERRSTPRK